MRSVADMPAAAASPEMRTGGAPARPRAPLAARARRAALRALWLCLRLSSLAALSCVLPLRIAVSPRMQTLDWLPVDLCVDVVALVLLLSEQMPRCAVGAIASSTLRKQSELRKQSSLMRRARIDREALEAVPARERRRRAARAAWLALDLCACVPAELILYGRSPRHADIPLAVLPRLIVMRRGGAWLGEARELPTTSPRPPP